MENDRTTSGSSLPWSGAVCFLIDTQLELGTLDEAVPFSLGSPETLACVIHVSLLILLVAEIAIPLSFSQRALTRIVDALPVFLVREAHCSQYLSTISYLGSSS